MKKNKLLLSLRWIFLALFLTIVTIQGYLHQVKGGDKAASIHALCPYGGLESLYSLMTAGTFIQKIFSGTFILFVLTLIIALLFRRSFCGLMCPFGALQEFFAILGKKLFRKKFVIPAKVDKPLRYLKYLILLITIYYAWKTSGLWMAPYDPWAAYAHLSEGIPSISSSSIIGFILLIITIIGSMLYDRFFCKYLCPMGAVYGIISKISPFKITRNEDKCISCGICNKSCPMNIDVANSNKITSSECINCQICVLSCPKNNCLQIKHGKKNTNPILAMSMVFIIFFGGIFISKSAGLYNTLPKTLPSGKTISSDEIKGYMTLKEVSERTKIDLKDLYKKLGVPDTVPSDTKFKELSKYVPGFSDEKAKEILKEK